MTKELMPAIRQQKPSDKLWKDEKGIEVQFTRLKASEKMQEKYAYKAFMDAMTIHDELQQFKKTITKYCDEVFNKIMSEHDVKKPGKGNFTWFNFDRTIKIEVNINERITFDDALITACQAKLNEFLKEELSDKQQFIQQLINDAFNKSRGSLDAKKVMSLLRHRQQIKAKKFHEACDLLEKSIRRPDSRTYYRVSYRKDNGEYQVIDLNFSSI